MKAKVCVSLLLAASLAMTLCAGTLPVTDYSWLQLPVEDITPFIGSTGTPLPINTSGYTGDGVPLERFRWGAATVTPNGVLTG